MATIYDVEPEELIIAIAEQLKTNENIKPLSWTVFAKTGPSRERPPVQKDWWYIRAAAVLRAVYKLGPVGVQKLRTKYGSKQRRGHQPKIFKKAGGNILRKILQQLDAAELTKKVEKGQHKGRILTPKGKSLVDKTATSIGKLKPVKTQVVKKDPVEVKTQTPKEIKKDIVKTEAPKEVKTDISQVQKSDTKEPTPKVLEKVPTAAELAAKKQ